MRVDVFSLVNRWGGVRRIIKKEILSHTYKTNTQNGHTAQDSQVY